MCIDEEKESLITFAGFGKKTGAVASGSTASDIGLRKTSAAAAVPAASAAGELFINNCYVMLCFIYCCYVCRNNHYNQWRDFEVFAGVWCIIVIVSTKLARTVGSLHHHDCDNYLLPFFDRRTIAVFAKLVHASISFLDAQVFVSTASWEGRLLKVSTWHLRGCRAGMSTASGLPVHGSRLLYDRLYALASGSIITLHVQRYR